MIQPQALAVEAVAKSRKSGLFVSVDVPDHARAAFRAALLDLGAASFREDGTVTGKGWALLVNGGRL